MERSDRKAAAALQYAAERDHAPRVIAKGWGILAEHILEIARAHDVPIHENAPLAQTLARLDEDVEIPAELYQVVAEVLAWVYRLDERRLSDRARLRPTPERG